MKDHFPLIILIIGYIVLTGAVSCYGTDEGGEWECLFCHQYPGLVIAKIPDGFQIISIDKEKHFSSPHGKIGCITCHKQVKKVPHTGVTEIGCTTECHSDDKEKIDAIDLSKYRVHENEQCSIENLDDRSSCRVCHSIYPHSKNNKVRAILNMHTGYMVCDVCHLNKEDLENRTYDWKSPDSVKFCGDPYGKYIKYEPEEQRKRGNFISSLLRKLFLKETSPGQADKNEYLISRIALFLLDGEKKTILLNTHDAGKAIEFKLREKSMSPEKKKKELNYFHKDVRRMEFSVACNECHASKSMLDFKKLGYDDKKAKYLKELDVKRLETEYEIFFFPRVLK